MTTGSLHGGLSRERGISLVVVLSIMSIIMVIGAIVARVAVVNERSSRNDRELQIAFQAAEAALADAERDIFIAGVTGRPCSFSPAGSPNFIPGCNTGATLAGLCATATPTATAPVHRSVDFTVTGTGQTSVRFGEFTGQTMVVGQGGTSVQLPRYIIEQVRLPPIDGFGGAVGVDPNREFAFLVTAVGFGYSTVVQARLQALIRQPSTRCNVN